MRTLFFAVMIMVSVSSWADYGVDNDFDYGVDKDFDYGVGGKGTVKHPSYPDDERD